MKNPITPLTPAEVAANEAEVDREGYFRRFLVGFDIFVNVITGGDEDETISSRSARAAIDGKWWGLVMSWFLILFQKDHGACAMAGDLERARRVEELEKYPGGKNQVAEENQMGRDPRKGAAFASGMRGREKPKVADAHGKTMGTESDSAGGGEMKQGANTVVGNPDGVSQTDSAYSSGMRGLETGKQKSASDTGKGGATYGQQREGKQQKEGKQEPDAYVGSPDGEQGAHNDAPLHGAQSGVSDASLRTHAAAAYKLGIPGNSTEQAASGEEPIGAEEDDTHINVRIPKASLKKKQGAGQAV